jgi:hypothetical protein
MRTFVALAAAVVSLSFVAAAPADAPVSARFTDSFSAVFASCESFDVIENATVRGKDTVYFDRDGHAVRHVVHLVFTGTFTNSVTGEVISPDRAAFTIDEGLDNPDATNEGPRPGTFRVLGLNLRIKVDGKTQAMEAGQLFVDIHDHADPADDEVIRHVGRHDLADGFDICAALA